MSKFIIIAEEKEARDLTGRIIGREPKRALFYDPKVGRRKIFKMSFNTIQENVLLLTFKSETGAQKICDITNQKFKDDFKVVPLVTDTHSEESKYHFAREIMFTLRSCNAITEAVYLHWIDKLNKDEEAFSSKSIVGMSACNTCGHSYDDDVYCKDCADKQTN